MSSTGNIPSGRRWDQGLIVHEVRDQPLALGQRGAVVRRVVLAPSKEAAKRWAARARSAGFAVKVGPYPGGLWCYEKIEEEQ